LYFLSVELYSLLTHIISYFDQFYQSKNKVPFSNLFEYEEPIIMCHIWQNVSHFYPSANTLFLSTYHTWVYKILSPLFLFPQKLKAPTWTSSLVYSLFFQVSLGNTQKKNDCFFQWQNQFFLREFVDSISGSSLILHLLFFFLYSILFLLQ
jgi:hypothetical protein